MSAILKGKRVSVVSCIMYDSILSACQDRKHLHFIRVTDGQCNFTSNMKQHSVCLGKQQSHLLWFNSKTYFHHIVLMGFHQTFVLLLAHYNEHFVLLLWDQNTNEHCDGTRQGMWINFPNSLPASKASDKLKRQRNWKQHKWSKIQIELTRHTLLKVVVMFRLEQTGKYPFIFFQFTDWVVHLFVLIIFFMM